MDRNFYTDYKADSYMRFLISNRQSVKSRTSKTVEACSSFLSPKKYCKIFYKTDSKHTQHTHTRTHTLEGTQLLHGFQQHTLFYVLMNMEQSNYRQLYQQ